MRRVSNPAIIDNPNRRLNVFLMMRFDKTAQLLAIEEAIKEAAERYALRVLLADGLPQDSYLWNNVKNYMDACDHGIAVFEQIDNSDFNPNVCIEVGYMRAMERPVLLLKGQRLPSLPSDLSGSLFKPFDEHDIQKTVKVAVQKWLTEIGIAKSSAERLLVFVSFGGTCRCAMAKVVLQQALGDRELPYRLRVESIAYRGGSRGTASELAQRVITEKYGKNLLEDHRVWERNEGILEDADLILVMAEDYKQDLPQQHLFGFNEFFGGSGDVKDPYVEKTIEAYRECLAHLRKTIEHNVDRIIDYLTSGGAP